MSQGGENNPFPPAGGGGLTSFQGRVAPAAVLTKADVTGTGLAQADVPGTAPTASPTFTGVVGVPTNAPLSGGNVAASQAYTDAAVAAAGGLAAQNFFVEAQSSAGGVCNQIELAIQAAQATGVRCRVVFKSGKTYAYGASTAPPQIGKNVPVELDLNGCTIQLSATAPRAFDYGPGAGGTPANYDTFDGISIHSGTVDCNNVTGGHHVIIGNYRGGVWDVRVNVTNNWVDDVKTINVPTSGTDRRNIAWGTRQLAAGEGTQNVISGNRATRVTMLGGNIGIQMVGVYTTTNVAGYNILVDKWHIEDCYHDTLVVPAGVVATGAGNYFIGSSAQVGSGIISNCYGANAGDVGIEIDSPQHAICDNVTIKDCWNSQFYGSAFNNPLDAQLNLWEWRSCNAVISNVIPHIGAFGCKNNNGVALGDFLQTNCTVECNLASAPLAVSGWAIYLGASTAINFRSARLDCTINVNTVFSGAGTSVCYPVYLAGAAAANGSPTTVSGRVVQIWTFNQTGAGQLKPTMIRVAGALMLDNLTLEVDYTSSGTGTLTNSMFCWEFGPSAGTSVQGSCYTRIRQIVGDTAPNGYSIGTTANMTINTRLDLGGDFTKAPAGMSGKEALFTGAQNRDKTWLDRLIPQAGTPPINVALSTSNMTTATFTTATWNQYLGGRRAQMVMAPASGAAITAVDVSNDGGTTVTNLLTQASGAMPVTGLQIDVDPGDWVRVTFTTTQPTTTLRYRRPSTP